MAPSTEQRTVPTARSAWTGLHPLDGVSNAKLLGAGVPARQERLGVGDGIASDHEVGHQPRPEEAVGDAFTVETRTHVQSLVGRLADVRVEVWGRGDAPSIDRTRYDALTSRIR